MPKHHHQGQRVFGSTQRDLTVKIKRAPGFKYTIIPCIDCGAEAGQPCVSSNGIPIGRGHMSRRRLAFRKFYEEVGDG